MLKAYSPSFTSTAGSEASSHLGSGYVRGALGHRGITSPLAGLGLALSRSHSSPRALRLRTEGDFIAYTDDFGECKVAYIHTSPEGRPLWYNAGDFVVIRKRAAVGHPVTAPGQEIRHELEDRQAATKANAS